VTGHNQLICAIAFLVLLASWYWAPDKGSWSGGGIGTCVVLVLREFIRPVKENAK
jgi:hypothetical protein